VKARLGLLPALYVAFGLVAADLASMAIWTDVQLALILAVVVAGLFLGVVNTLVTEAVMRVSPVERPTASAAYSFVRFSGGAVAPWLAGRLAEWYDPHVPFAVGAAGVGLAMLVLFAHRGHVVERPHAEPTPVERAYALTADEAA
jgi:predicted MFS family arabinose efflux permease